MVSEPVTFEIVGCGDGESGAVIELSVYRAAFVPALLAAVLAMFSLQDRPRPLPQGLAADVLFDGRQAAARADGDRRGEPRPDRGQPRRPGHGGRSWQRALADARLLAWSGTASRTRGATS